MEVGETMTNAKEMLQEWRKSLGWTRVYISERTGVSLSTITDIERKKDCKVSTLLRILTPLGYELKIQRKKLV